MDCGPPCIRLNIWSLAIIRVCSKHLLSSERLAQPAALGSAIKTFYACGTACRICALSSKGVRKVIRSVVMHRKIGTAILALVLFAGPSTMSFAQNSTNGAANPKEK